MRASAASSSLCGRLLLQEGLVASCTGYSLTQVLLRWITSLPFCAVSLQVLMSQYSTLFYLYMRLALISLPSWSCSTATIVAELCLPLHSHTHVIVCAHDTAPLSASCSKPAVQVTVLQYSSALPLPLLTADVIKTTLQSQPSDPAKRAATTIVGAARLILRESGWRGFTKGVA
jgi:transmembrane carrier protein